MDTFPRNVGDHVQDNKESQLEGHSPHCRCLEQPRTLATLYRLPTQSTCLGFIRPSDYAAVDLLPALYSFSLKCTRVFCDAGLNLSIIRTSSGLNKKLYMSYISAFSFTSRLDPRILNTSVSHSLSLSSSPTLYLLPAPRTVPISSLGVRAWANTGFLLFHTAVLIGPLTVAHVIKEVPVFMFPEDALPCSQAGTNCPF
jgi:hypothetical protein